MGDGNVLMLIGLINYRFYGQICQYSHHIRFTYNNPMRIGIDFDDVVADTLDALMRMHNEQFGSNLTRPDFISYHLEEVWGGTREEAVKKIDAFFTKDQRKEIEPMMGALAGIEALKKQGHELYIVTGRSEKDVAQTEQWIEHHLADIFAGVHYASFFDLEKNTPRKKLDICKELGIEIMIDDNLPTALECAAGGIKALLFDQPWNPHDSLPPGITRVHTWEDVVKIIQTAQ